MNSKHILSAIACLVVSGFSAMVQADDTDIYNNPAATAGSALVMFTLDDRSSTTSTYGGCTANQSCEARTYFSTQGVNDIPDSKAITFLDALRLALKVALAKLPAEAQGVKIGLMLNHQRDNSSAVGDIGTSIGTYVNMGFTSLSSGGAALLDTKLKAVRTYGTDTNALGSSTFNGHAYQGMAMYYEFYHYLTGQDIWAGHQGYNDYNKPADNANNNDFTPSKKNKEINLDEWLTQYYAAGSLARELTWDTGVENDTNTDYVTPLDDEFGCGKIYMINLFFGNSQDGSAIAGSNNSPGPIRDTVANGGMGLGRNPSFEDAVAWLKGTDIADGAHGSAPTIDGTQDVTSFFLYNGNIQNTVNSYAVAGGSGAAIAMSEDPAALVDAFDRIFSQILSVSTTFVSASVPANVFNRAEITDNLFTAVFQAESVPFWTGNVKRLRLTPDANGNFSAYDALNALAVNATDGRINDLALTYWTDPNGRDVLETTTLDEFQAPTTTNRPPGTTGRDGRDTYRGGAGQQIPGFLDAATPDPTLAGDPGQTNATAGARQMFYVPSFPSIPNTTPVSLTDLEYTATPSAYLKTQFGAATDADGAAVLSYIRGYSSNDGTGTSRRWLMGDPMHSRPFPINFGALVLPSPLGAYNDTDNQGIFLAVGTNDGQMRLIKNSEPDSGAASGEELWSYMTEEGLGIQQRLKDNNSATDFQYANSVHPYGVDGTPVILATDASDVPVGVPTSSGNLYLFFGLRRGGRSYYALKLNTANPGTPPQLAWRISNNTTGFSKLGLTFARPQLGRIRYDDGTGVQTVNILVFGGGYDYEHNDYYRTPTAPSSAADTMGNVIYIVRAETGELLKVIDSSMTGASNMKKSIAADATLVDTDKDGYTDRIVVPDVYGGVWRVDIADSVSPADWTVHEVAQLGPQTVSDAQHFFHQVDFVQARDSLGAYDGIIVGAGDRSNPIDCAYDGVYGNCTRTTPIVNYLYVIKDRDTGVRKDVSGAVTPAYSTTKVTTDLSDVTACPDPNGTCDLTDIGNGWKLQMTDSGEKVLSSPFTFLGKIFFTTYVPVPTNAAAISCGPAEGTGYFYAVNLADGLPGYDLQSGANNDDGTYTADDRRKQLASGGIPSDVVPTEGGHLLLPDLSDFDTESSAFIRTYWRRNGR